MMTVVNSHAIEAHCLSCHVAWSRWTWRAVWASRWRNGAEDGCKRSLPLLRTAISRLRARRWCDRPTGRRRRERCDGSPNARPPVRLYSGITGCRGNRRRPQQTREATVVIRRGTRRVILSARGAWGYRRRFPCGRPVHRVSMRRRHVTLVLHVHRRCFTRKGGRHRGLQRNGSSSECRGDETTKSGHLGEVMHEIADRLAAGWSW